jgi:hypothetical protein
VEGITVVRRVAGGTDEVARSELNCGKTAIIVIVFTLYLPDATVNVQYPARTGKRYLRWSKEVSHYDDSARWRDGPWSSIAIACRVFAQDAASVTTQELPLAAPATLKVIPSST